MHASATDPDPRRIIVIETSSRFGSAALATDQNLVDAARLPGQMRHAGELLPTIARMLAVQGWLAESLTDLFVSIGPGSFTGLRVGVTVARTLAWSLKLKIVAVPTLDVIAENALAADPVPAHLAVLLDAKRAQVFAGVYDLAEGRCRTVTDAHLTDPRALLATCPRPLAILGEGIPYHRQAVDASGARVLDETLWWPQAENVYQVGLRMARNGHYVDAGNMLPLYIRRPEAEEKWEKLYGPQGRRPR